MTEPEFIQSTPVTEPESYIPGFELTTDQENAIKALLTWWDESDEQVFRLFGYAGTGKTTIALHFPRLLGVDNYRFGAFSGKAVNVLASKMKKAAANGQIPEGMENNCGTLHSLIYGAPIDLKAEKRRVEEQIDGWDAAIEKKYAVDGVDYVDTPIMFYKTPLTDAQEMRDYLVTQSKDIDTRARKFGWLYFPPPTESPLAGVELLIADEVSMVSGQMAADILSTGVRVIVLGDPFQLPPVNGDGYFTDAKPDAMLTQIRRQEADSRIYNLANRLRHGLEPTLSEYENGSTFDYTKPKQVLCWTRLTRWGGIKYIRRQLGRPDGVPVPGDRVMNLANNKDVGVFNGQIFVVEQVEATTDPDVLKLQVHEDGLDVSFPLFCFVHGFKGLDEEKAAERNRLGSRGPNLLLTFAQVLTVHKAQGSEWDTVLFIDETARMFNIESRKGSPFDAMTKCRRFSYTAITRASETVWLIRKS
jgi:exodeoxyribonuclease-5